MRWGWTQACMIFLTAKNVHISNVCKALEKTVTFPSYTMSALLSWTSFDLSSLHSPLPFDCTLSLLPGAPQCLPPTESALWSSSTAKKAWVSMISTSIGEKRTPRSPANYQYSRRIFWNTSRYAPLLVAPNHTLPEPSSLPISSIIYPFHSHELLS